MKAWCVYPVLLTLPGACSEEDGVEQFRGKDSIVFVARSDFDQLETEAQGGGTSGTSTERTSVASHRFEQ